MKRILVLGLLVFSGSLFAGMDGFHIDGRAYGFYPSGELFRHVFDKWQVGYQVEAGQIFLKNYEVWANMDWLATDGRTMKFHLKTRFRTFNLSFGAKNIFRVHKRIKLYLGLGINRANVHFDFPFPEHTVRAHTTGIGGVAKLGIYLEPVNHLFFDFFVDYLYQKINLDGDIQVGGIKSGGGIGFCF